MCTDFKMLGGKKRLRQAVEAFCFEELGGYAYPVSFASAESLNWKPFISTNVRFWLPL